MTTIKNRVLPRSSDQSLYKGQPKRRGLAKQSGLRRKLIAASFKPTDAANRSRLQSQLGVQRGDRIAILSFRRPNYVGLQWPM